MCPLLIVSFMFLAGPFGIDVGYYAHLGAGQWRLIWNQTPVSEVTADEETDPATRDRLLRAEQIRSYAINQLGLECSVNYTTYTDIGDRPAVWALTVSPADRIEPHRWSYPVIGSAPYRGFFDYDRAVREQDRFRERGFDTYLRGVSAFSTLGWFRDPLLSPMLRYSALDLANVLIHELLHATIWIEGEADFNESLANFVGRQGARSWATDVFENGLDSLAAMKRAQTDRALYRDLMHGLAAQLDSVYSLDIPGAEKLAQKAAAIGILQERVRSTAWQTNRYGDPDTWTINNATLALFRTYNRSTDVFDRVLEQTGSLPASLRVFQECEGQRNPEAYLERWLETNTTLK